MPSSELRAQLAAPLSLPLRVRAKKLAAGFGSGQHRASRKGSGIEFAGHRAYTPGDDLRHLDHHALMRHGQLLIREFYTDTERPLHLVIDGTASMRYRSRAEQQAAQAPQKLDRALLLGAAALHLAHSAGDGLGLSLLSDTGTLTWKPRTGSEVFERILSRLEEAGQPRPKDSIDTAGPGWVSLFQHLGTALPRGSLILVLSDCFDLTGELSQELARLNSKNRTVRAAQVLTSDEKLFPFAGAVRLLDPETQQEIETDADGVRQAYQAALSAHTEQLKSALHKTGAAFLQTLTEEKPNNALRFLLEGALPLEGAPP